MIKIREHPAHPSFIPDQTPGLSGCELNTYFYVYTKAQRAKRACSLITVHARRKTTQLNLIHSMIRCIQENPRFTSESVTRSQIVTPPF